jgi:hypothetical protein
LLARIGGVGEGHQLLEWEDRIKKRKQEEEAAKIALAKAAAEKAAAEKAKAAAAADKKPACGAGEDTAKTSDGPAAAKPAVQH